MGRKGGCREVDLQNNFSHLAGADCSATPNSIDDLTLQQRPCHFSNHAQPPQQLLVAGLMVMLDAEVHILGQNSSNNTDIGRGIVAISRSSAALPCSCHTA
jgi:hypothetical protein